jgi:superfamily II DNA or RNA helicase
MRIKFPQRFAINATVSRNAILQLASDAFQTEGRITSFTSGRIHGWLFQSSEAEILILPKRNPLPVSQPSIVQGVIDETAASVDLSIGSWLRHPSMPLETPLADPDITIQEIRESWRGAVSYIQENPVNNVVGLRGPQIGAVHAVHSHWSVSDKTGTIVMPTGTGKTEAMLTVLISACCEKLLVVVPTDALRIQLAQKFLTLGILKHPRCTVLAEIAKCPIVCILQHIPQSLAEADQIFSQAQVVVTTSAIAGQCAAEIQERIAHHCSHLFIDEAHHAEAPTWSAFKDKFKSRRILQFTATPFREDGRPLDGKIIYTYPLKRAQEEGYFKAIQFKPVVEFNRSRADEAIAAKAVEQLRSDADKGHILMARVETVTRANQVFGIYQRYTEFNPVQLHTGIKSSREREKLRKQILSGESRIVVCVDMLGEGFDLPELKIAAFHDIRKTLAVTLQLAGRFTRARPDLGNATFIANTADVDVQSELRKLYTRDPDWNVLLPQLSESMIGEQESLQHFLSGFTQFAEEIPLKTVRPATSTVVYRTDCTNWTPHNFRSGIAAVDSCEQIHDAVNETEHTLVFVTARRVPLPWTDVQSLYNWDWELYVVIWVPDQQLLFINTSSNAGEYRLLAQAVAGESAALISGQQVFRAFSGVNRLRLQNVGLTEQLGRNIRYTGRMGADVSPGISDVNRRRARKSVLAGSGFEAGETATIGASRKGRIWSHKRERVDQLAVWCRHIGAKLLDASIDPDEVLKGTLDAETVLTRPARIPISTDWPEDVYTSLENLWSIILDGQTFHLSQVTLDISAPSLTGNLRIGLFLETGVVEIDLELLGDAENPDYQFTIQGQQKVSIQRGGSVLAITDFFYDYPPVIWFADGSSLEGNQYVQLKHTFTPFDRAKIQVLDWTGINIRKESQGRTKDATTIQARIIQELLARDYQMIIDDDDCGEAADIVTIRLVGDLAAPAKIEGKRHARHQSKRIRYMRCMAYSESTERSCEPSAP